MSKTLRLGLVGLGLRGQGWLRNIKSIRDCHVTALCDTFPALLKAGQAIVADGDVRCYESFERMLEDAPIDAVAIVVAPEHQPDLIVKSVGASKHVIAEVPLALTMDDCWRIVVAVEKSGVKFQLAEQVRFSSCTRQWKQMVSEGQLGKVLFCEGQYLHGMGNDRYWHDAETGARVPFDQVGKRKLIKSRFWNLRHSILYLPHELSPLLHILDDRVVRVTGMGTRPQSYRHEWFPQSDIEVALMHTEKDTILRLATTFTVETLRGSEHCNRLIGVNGWVEQARTRSEKGKMWLAGMNDKRDVDWDAADDGPSDAAATGHDGMDYYPVATFVDAVLRDQPLYCDVYTAAETAAPAILAAQSIEQGSVCLNVPDFRPGKNRKAGQLP
ncbi:MAG TPA: Gfo/Idh/MocA family oxidoreductase [Planctomycetota bacterium]|nr:Gfo/Idh/MocA family oxidoreductase [Planctomycetota bacterium]